MATSLPPIDWEAESYPAYPDFAAIPFFAVFFLAVRFLLDRFVFEWLARKLIFKKGDEKLDPTTYAGKRKIRKFKESAWKCIYFLSVILAIHDASDVFLELGKISKYSGHELLADVSFLVFVSSWVLLRLIYYPFWILWSTSYEVVLTLDKEKHNFDGPIYYYVFNILLFSLLVLHIYWWVLMYRMLVKQILSGGHVGDDIRSDPKLRNMRCC
ncbi:ASC1-like protein isoform X3 [Panicum miliaceum]|uniref:ASC1-like protein isoform X3 n=1 Tax=Panicum miliaceum TaxID=4540 RepID=A0A3L6QJE6_PANMI|nr:ASC1-like protein isoform X3 [Panicum miliaceum]